MDHFSFEPAESAGRAQRDCEETNSALGRAVSPPDELLLSAIDRVIRSLCLRGPVLAMLQPDPPRDTACGQVTPAAPHHPDAAEVLGRCRSRHPSRTEFADGTIRAACRNLLYERWRCSVFERICGEAPAVTKRVLSQITNLSPSGCDDDAWLVWWQLAAYDSDNLDYEYTDRQICKAWRIMIALRSRWDGRDPRRPSPEDIDRVDDGVNSRDDPVGAELETQEFVEALCEGMGESAYACVLEQLLDGDNWSADLIDRVADHCPSYVGGSTPPKRKLSKQQRYACRRRLERRAVELGVDVTPRTPDRE